MRRRRRRRRRRKRRRSKKKRRSFRIASSPLLSRVRRMQHRRYLVRKLCAWTDVEKQEKEKKEEKEKEK
jgi:hypothetical protein